jgi:hypothetical protein
MSARSAPLDHTAAADYHARGRLEPRDARVPAAPSEALLARDRHLRYRRIAHSQQHTEHPSHRAPERLSRSQEAGRGVTPLCRYEAGACGKSRLRQVRK